MSAPAGPDGRPDPARAEVAGMAAVIERAEADLSLVEEPARFAAALEAGAPDEPAPLPDPSRAARRASASRSTTR
jgi:hypothetical protein